MPEAIFRFAEALRALSRLVSAERFEERWEALDPCGVGWDALARTRLGPPRREVALDEVDGLLLRLLDRVPVLAGGSSAAAVHIRTFRMPELERLQHATAAALVAERYGAAGLHTVVADDAAPLARRYFAFLALAERHPDTEWHLFSRYLTPAAHHAFVGAAAEAARFYPADGAAARLVALFDRVRGDLHLRAFLSPRILESLYVLADPATLPFFRELLTAGFTDQDPEHCEVTRALVMVYRFTGKIEPNAKYAEIDSPAVVDAIEAAARRFERRREVMQPVIVI